MACRVVLSTENWNIYTTDTKTRKHKTSITWHKPIHNEDTMKRSNSPDLKDCNTNGQIGSAKYFTRLAESIFGSDPITRKMAGKITQCEEFVNKFAYFSWYWYQGANIVMRGCQ